MLLLPPHRFRTLQLGTCAMIIVTIVAAVSCKSRKEELFEKGAKPMSSCFCAVLAGHLYSQHSELSPADHIPNVTEQIVCKVFTTNAQELWVSRAVEERYYYLIRLLNAQGEKVPETVAGRVYGSKFFALKEYQDARMVDHLAYGSRQGPGTSMSGGWRLPHTPDQLFRIEDPGIYVLEMCVQIFFRTNGILVKTNGVQCLERLPVARLKIRKE